MSNESEYGDVERARFRLTLARILPGRGELSRLAASMLKWKSALASELAGCRSAMAFRALRYSEVRPRPVDEKGGFTQIDMEYWNVLQWRFGYTGNTVPGVLGILKVSRVGSGYVFEP